MSITVSKLDIEEVKKEEESKVEAPL